jgi:hypothetical protein
VVDLEGFLEAVGSLGPVAEDAAGVVGEHVNARVGAVEVGGELADVIELGEVGEEVVGADLAGDRLGFPWRAADDDMAAVLVKLAGGGRPDPIAGPGDGDCLRHGLIPSAECVREVG